MSTTFYLPLGEQYLSFNDCSHCVFYYKSYTLDILSGTRKKSSLCDLGERLKEISIREFPQNPRVWHFFFEWGYYYYGLSHLIAEDDLLAIEMRFEKVVRQTFKERVDFLLKDFSYPTFKEYKKSFHGVRKHLLRGDCYQVNLTFPFDANFQGEFFGILKSLWNDGIGIGAYAHGTFFPELKKSFISQSPECLFTIQKKKQGFFLRTMPIKGSLSCQSKDQWEKKWQELDKNKKDAAELSMVTDLLRNDLNRIGTPRAGVVKKKMPLLVPGILHQYALIECPLSSKTSLGKIMEVLFPGGSVTGPPKKRVLEIIYHLERERRGLYCGTTVIQHGSLFCGNINIRTASLDHHLNRLRYFAGGGITLLSEVKSEYEEMLLKLESFRMALTPRKEPSSFF